MESSTNAGLGSNNAAAFYAGVVALAVIGVIIIVSCVVCKFCTNGKDCLVKRLLTLCDEPDDEESGKQLTRNVEYGRSRIKSDESQFMLGAQQGNYMVSDTLDRDISVGGLPDVIPQASTSSSHVNMATVKKHDEGDEAKLNSLKAAPRRQSNNRRSYSEGGRRYSDMLQGGNNYTIYEESSDFSGNEVLPGDDCEADSSDSDLDHVTPPDDRVSVLCDMTDTLHLLSQHMDDAELGQLEYSVQYDRESSQLLLHIIQARDLDTNSPTGTLDCFIKAFSSHCQENDPKKQTRICKGTANPVFKENFLFRMAELDLASASLTLQIFSRDHYARQRLIGEITVELSNFIVHHTYRTWSRVLDYDHQPLPSCGEAKVSLLYEPKHQQFTVNVQELSAIKWPSRQQTGDLFLYATLLNEGNKPLNKLISKTMQAEQTAHINANFIFTDVDHDNLINSKLIVEICEQLPDSTSHTFGYFLLGAEQTDREYAHWVLMYTQAESINMYHQVNCAPLSSRYRSPINLR